MAPMVIKYYHYIYNWNNTLEEVSSCVSYSGGKKSLIENNRNFIKTDRFLLVVT